MEERPAGAGESHLRFTVRDTGVGMSEASDAVVVIVSEETGTISVAVGGMLKRHLAPQTLDKLLHNELCPANDGDEKQDLSLRLKQKLQPRRKETDDNEK